MKNDWKTIYGDNVSRKKWIHKLKLIIVMYNII
jgi:hypothetical protein